MRIRNSHTTAPMAAIKQFHDSITCKQLHGILLRRLISFHWQRDGEE